MSESSPSSFVIYFVALAYVLFGLLAILRESVAEPSFVLVVSIIAVAGGIGVIVRKPWSAYLLLAASFFVIAGLAYHATPFLMENWHSPHFPSIAILLLPHGFVAFAAAACPYLVFRYFHFIQQRS